MTILLADTSLERLRDIALSLNEMMPDEYVLCASDPLMAAKFALTQTVDLLIARLYMPRITGLQLCEFVREKTPRAKLCLTGTPEEFAACEEDLKSEMSRVVLPATKEAIRAAFSR